ALALRYQDYSDPRLESYLQPINRAVEIGERQTATFPDHPGSLFELAESYAHKATMLENQRRTNEAGSYYSKAWTIAQKLFKDNPGAFKTQEALVLFRDYWAGFLARNGRKPEADRVLREELKLREETLGDLTDNFRDRVARGKYHQLRFQIGMKAGDPNGA